MDENRSQDREDLRVARPKDGHPLGPLVWREPLARPVLGRLVAAGIVVACGWGLVTAALLQPSARGYGTHKLLGMSPCGFLMRTGFPCPTCGMTTSCSLTVRGRIIAALRTQALGPVLVLGAVVCGLGGLAVALTGKVWAVNWYRVSPTGVIWALGIALIAAWGLKIVLGLLDGTLPADTF